MSKLTKAVKTYGLLCVLYILTLSVAIQCNLQRCVSFRSWWPQVMIPAVLNYWVLVP